MLRTASLAPWVGLLLAAGVAWGQGAPASSSGSSSASPSRASRPSRSSRRAPRSARRRGRTRSGSCSTAVQVDGVTVYPAAEIRADYADLLGTEITLARVYELAAALTRKYRNDGYVLSQVVVPQQAIRAGSVRLQAIEGHVANVRIEGEVLGPRADLDAYTDRIRASRPLRAADLERYLLLVNELAGVTARATLSPAAEPGASDLTIDVSQYRARGAIGLTNRRQQVARTVARRRFGDVYSLFGAFDRTSVRVIQTLFDSNELTFLTGAYERPLGTDGLKAIVTGELRNLQPGAAAEPQPAAPIR